VTDTLRLELATTLEAVAEGQSRLAAFLRRAGMPEPVVARAETVLEEVAMNVIRHGFADPAALAAAAVTVEVRTGGPEADGAGRCTLVFEDPGRPFDPTATPLLPPARRLEEATIGGLGIPLVRRMAQALTYRRLEPEGRNRLTVVLGPP
jgi:anti-sigma regulatory factor (Ser/Thr protein kinase)